MTNVGFIGLGAMGFPMAGHLASAGHTVYGFDISEATRERFGSQINHVATSVAEVVSKSEVVITMLPAAPHVQSMYMDQGGIFDLGKPGQIFADCSTIGVDAARLLHSSATQRGLRFLDTPVSGAVPAATAGTLTFMIGGLERDAQDISPVLTAMGKKIVYAGKGGSGQAIKICNNMAMGIMKAAISEAFVLSDALGIDPKTFFEVASNGSAQSFVLNVLCPVPGILPNAPSSREYKNGFSTKLMHKDLQLARDAALKAGVKLEMVGAAANLFSECLDAGYGDLDNAVLYQYLKTKTPSKGCLENWVGDVFVQ